MRASCIIDGVEYGNSALQEGNMCMTCDVSQSTTEWVPMPNQSDCLSGHRCQDGVCTPSYCNVDFAIRAPGELNPNNSCQECDPFQDVFAWSVLADGSSCDGGGSCAGGACVPPGPQDAIDPSLVDLIGYGTQGPDVFTWTINCELNGMGIHWANHYGPFSWYLDLDADGYTDWPSYLPYGEGTPVNGNIWILVQQPNSSRWWAAPFEGLGDFTTIFPAGNLNFDHTNLLESTPLASPWQPQSGVVYGWMLSGNVVYPGNNIEARSNIHLEAWP